MVTFSLSEQTIDSLAEMDEGEKPGTVLQRALDFVTTPIHFFSEFFFLSFTFEEPWMPSRKYIQVIQKRNTLVDLHQTSPATLLRHLVQKKEFDKALTIASDFQLSTDDIFKV